MDTQTFGSPITFVMAGKPEIAEFLIEKGVDVNAKEDVEFGGKTALSWCACMSSKKKENKEDFLEIAKLLIDKGADVNAKCTVGMTPLMDAAFGNSLEMAELLIENGADINARMTDGHTALKLAEENANSEMATLLKKHAAK